MRTKHNAHLVWFLMMEPVHPGSSPRLGTGARIFLDLLQSLTSTILSVVDDVLIDSEAYVVTSSISKIYWLSLLNTLIGVGLHAYIYKGECASV